VVQKSPRIKVDNIKAFSILLYGSEILTLRQEVEK